MAPELLKLTELDGQLGGNSRKLVQHLNEILADVKATAEEALMKASFAAGGEMYRDDGGAFKSRKYSLELRDPALIDNKDRGYEVGSVWVNTLKGKMWLYSGTEWIPISGVRHTLDASRPPSPRDKGHSRGAIWIDAAEGEVYMYTAVGKRPWRRLSARDYDTFRFSKEGTAIVDARINGAWSPPFPGVITCVTVIRGSTTGTGGSLIADVNLNGVTIFTNQSKRPTVPYDHATGIVSVEDIDDHDNGIVHHFAKDAVITFDIDQIESGGSPSDVDLIVGVEFGGVYHL
jgi:hypothetical protein